jgi:phosphoglycolate/pyridoxal phosphate phosphatase family enzyme
MRIADLYDHFLFDLDGCVYLGDEVILSAPETLAELRRMGKGVLFLTNAPYISRDDYAAKLRGMGIQARPDEILSSSWATAEYIREHHDVRGKSVFVVGSESFKGEMRAAGLRVAEGEDAARADFVVVGGYMDFCYMDIVLANFAIRNGALFYASNRDATFPTPRGVMPGTGAILASLEVASGQAAIPIGKPELPMIEVARALLGEGRMLMVGDRLDTDIAGGKRAGIGTALVLTGISCREDLAGTPWTPDHVLDSVGGLIEPRVP